MNTIRIENKPLADTRKPRSHAEMWAAVKKLEIGQSFLVTGLDSNCRNGLGIAAEILGRKFTSRREGPKESNLYRIYRVG